jgi:hypothetical protein
MNSQLIESLAQIIQSLSPEEQGLLATKMNSLAQNKKAFQKGSFYQTATPEEWIRALREWSESHRRDIPWLSEEAVSRRGIYEED